MGSKYSLGLACLLLRMRGHNPRLDVSQWSLAGRSFGGPTRLHVGHGVDTLPSCTVGYWAVFEIVAASSVWNGSLDGDHVWNDGLGLGNTRFAGVLAGEVTTPVTDQLGSR